MVGKRPIRALLILLAAAWILATRLPGQVARIEVERREPILGGRSFGEVGAYERLEGWLHFALDPADPRNARIVDLDKAPRNEQGRVEARANFLVLQPVEPERGRQLALLEVSNRGGKASLSYFNRASGSRSPESEGEFGDGLLMRLGLTVIWVGWQFDVPSRGGQLRLEVPTARGSSGETFDGLVRADWVIEGETASLALGHRNHRAYPVSDPADPANVLTVRDGREAPRRPVPRDRWRFAREADGEVVEDPRWVHLEGGFETGKIYELVYRAVDPAVVGMGLAAIRDTLSFAKYDPRCPFPVEEGFAVGISQTGRFLRHFLYQGFNTDTAGRPVMDGAMIFTAGAGRGSFNHRFAQPSRDAHRYSAFFFPTDLFPFSSRLQEDPLTGRLDGLFARQWEPDHLPRVFLINTGYEYWGRAASLTHTTLDGGADFPPTGRERIYAVSSAQHFPGRFPQATGDRMGEASVYRSNPMDLRALYRALLARMTEWIDEGTAPPPSAYPRIADGHLVPVAELRDPGIPGLALPRAAHVAYRADYGPLWSQGVVTRQPPDLGAPFPSLVAQMDALGREQGGAWCLELRVPLASYLPWSLRHGRAGEAHELDDFVGSYAPFPRTEAEKEERGDPRPSLEELYGDRAAFLEQVRDAAQGMVGEGWILAEDVDAAVEKAGRHWDWIHALP